jgi:hypothetical protein
MLFLVWFALCSSNMFYAVLFYAVLFYAVLPCSAIIAEK